MKILIQIFMAGLLFAFNIPESHAKTQSQTFSRSQIVFGNVPLKIEISGNLTKEKAFREMEKGFAVVKNIDSTLSPYRKDSELSQLNALKKPAYNIKLSPLLCEALKAGLRFTKLTSKHFDVTFPMQHPNADAIYIDQKCRADLLDEKLKVDPTGLVKGLTVDLILQLLKKNKRIQSALVAASGDIGHFDRNNHSTEITLYNPTPFQKNSIVIKLNNQAVSTSGFYERGRHIKNTGHASQSNHLQTTVIADNGVTSDAVSTALIFMPELKMRQLVKNFAGIRVIVYRANGSILEL